MDGLGGHRPSGISAGAQRGIIAPAAAVLLHLLHHQHCKQLPALQSTMCRCTLRPTEPIRGSGAHASGDIRVTLL